jgi:hypothetical protein
MLMLIKSENLGNYLVITKSVRMLLSGGIRSVSSQERSSAGAAGLSLAACE